MDLCKLTLICAILPGLVVFSGTLHNGPATQVEAKETSLAHGGKPLGRFNQDPANLEDGIAIPASLALKKGGKEKIAFLTFDDGPSPNSPKVLRILEKHGVHATFFIVGSMAKRYPKELKAEYEAGNAIGNHSYTHDYPKVYRTVWTMIDEINRTESVMEKALGPTFRTKLFRFPGGYMGYRKIFKGHKERYAKTLKDCGMHFIDWNVDCGDTAPRPFTSSQLVANVMSEAKGQNRIVVLMHDAGAKFRTVEALPAIIAGLKKRGYVFRTLD